MSQVFLFRDRHDADTLALRLVIFPRNLSRFGKVDGAPPHLRLACLVNCYVETPGKGIGAVIGAMRPVIDRILAGAMHAPL